jgi:uncharacterized membrane protein YdjX (TVP38/TMEM64 family)
MSSVVVEPPERRPSPWRWFALFVGAVAAALMVPFLLAAPTINRWFTSFEDRSGATWTVALVVVALLAVDIVAPVPSSIVAAFAGVTFGAWLGSALVFAGLGIGCALGYAGASRVRPGLLRKRRGAAAVASASAMRARDGAMAIVVARPVPLLAEATVVVAGLTAMRKPAFAGACAVGNGVVAVLFAALPATVG